MDLQTQFSPGSPPAVVAGAAAMRCTARPRRVLVVEDHLDSGRTLATLLMQIGHHVELAVNGRIALDIARKFKPHVVLLDLGLPGLDGYEVSSRIKYDPDFGGTRVIALTAYSQDEHRIRSRAAGCELHLVKPVQFDTLFDVLEAV